MGTVGLTFGSATSGAGFDVATTVTSILSIQQGIETPWQTQLTALKAQDTVFSSIGTDLSTLTTAVQALTDPGGVLAEKQGSSSDENVLTLTSASTVAVAGSHTVTVNSLATTASAYSNSISDSTAVLSGTITIGSATPIVVSAANSNNTISSLAAAINSASIGVTASVISDANGSRLSLVSSTGGTAGQALITGITNSLTYTTATDSTPTSVGFPGTQAQESTTLSDPTSLLAGSITIGSGTPITITSGVNDTLATLAASINTASLGVTASVLTDSTGSHLSIESVPPGSATPTITNALTYTTATNTTPTTLALTAANTEYSQPITDPTALLTGTLTIGTSTPITISAANGNNTLASLAASINTASLGVDATVITDANGSRLSLVSTTPGAAGQTTLNGIANAITYTTSTNATPTSLGFPGGQTGVNASLTVDGIAISSASNTVSTAIPGVTFQLLSSAPGTSVQVQVTNDNSAIETAVQTFVTAYNAVNKDINTQEGNDASGNPEPLFGNSSLSLMQSQLQTALLGGTSSGSINSITQLGISVGDDGTLTFTSTDLDSTLNASFANVQGFLQNSKSFGQLFSTALNNLGTQAPSGLTYLAQQQNIAQEAALNLSITNENTLIATEKTTLTTELNSANQILQSIPSQLSEINEMYSAVSGYNSNQA
jgi:flagellar hook-associated protein 2